MRNVYQTSNDSIPSETIAEKKDMIAHQACPSLLFGLSSINFFVRDCQEVVKNNVSHKSGYFIFSIWWVLKAFLSISGLSLKYFVISVIFQK